MVAAIFYLLTGVCTAALMDLEYERHERHSLLGSIIAGLIWPLALPCIVLMRWSEGKE